MSYFINRVGDKWLTNEGYEIEIIEYFNKKTCTIKFSSGYTIERVQYINIKRGSIKNPYHKSVFGVGYFGVGEYKAKINKKNY